MSDLIARGLASKNAAQLASNTSDIQGRAINIKYPFGTSLTPVKGDGTTDDTVALQAMIDYAYTNNTTVYVPDGIYYVGTLSLPNLVYMYGNNKMLDPYQNVGISKRVKIQCYAPILFQKENGVNVNCITLKGIAFECVASNPSTAVAFNGMTLHNCLIEENTFLNFGRIFGSTLEQICRIRKNQFLGIKQYFIKTSDILPSATSSITDSYIENNYINGDTAYNATAFSLFYPATSAIKDNYIDFFKFGISIENNSQLNAVIISGNTFDIVYKGVYGPLNSTTINSNIFIHIGQSYASYFTNADSYMKGSGVWACVEGTTAFNAITVSNNIVNSCDVFVRLNTTYNVYNAKVIGNNFSNVTTKIDLEAVVPSGGNGFTNNYFDDLMYQTFTTLPNPTLTTDGTGGLRITTFDKQIAFYNGKMIYNASGTWKYYDGTSA